MTYPKISADDLVLPWFAGASNWWLDQADFDGEEHEWEGGSACLEFEETGIRDTDYGPSLRGQIVMHIQHHNEHLSGRSISLEIDRVDAHILIAKLQAFITDSTPLNEDEVAALAQMIVDKYGVTTERAHGW